MRSNLILDLHAVKICYIIIRYKVSVLCFAISRLWLVRLLQLDRGGALHAA